VQACGAVMVAFEAIDIFEAANGGFTTQSWE
jgi:hypothetical protein